MRKRRLAIIGLGAQVLEDHLPALRAISSVELIAVTDRDPEKTIRVANELGLRRVDTVAEVISLSPDIVLVAVPHSEYFPIVSMLLDAGISVFKEKPLASTVSEAVLLLSKARKSGARLGVAVQRRFNPVFETARRYIELIGRPFSVRAAYGLNIENLDDGWRALFQSSRGGALLDMGYHFIDLLVQFFGVPRSLIASTSNNKRFNQHYEVEDTAHVLLRYEQGDDEASHHEWFASLVVSRVNSCRVESVEVQGERGAVIVERYSASRFDVKGHLIEKIMREGPSSTAATLQLLSFIRSLDEPRSVDVEHLKHVSIIEAAYLSATQRREVAVATLFSEACELVMQRE